MTSFTKDTATTIVVRVINVGIGIGQSVVIARLLGPEGKGFYTLAVLFSTLLIVVANMGLHISTAYRVARGSYPKQLVFGNTIALSLVLGFGSVIVGLGILSFFHGMVMPNVPRLYAFLAVFLIPLALVSRNTTYLFLGSGQIGYFNIFAVFHAAVEMILTVLIVWGLDGGVVGAIIASFVSFCASSVGILWVGVKEFGKPQIDLRRPYLGAIFGYGAKVHGANILAFLNYRLVMFIVNAFLSPIQVGYYSVAVGIAEKLSLPSQAAGVVLFPRVASGNDTDRNAFTPVVTRNVLWLTALGMAFLYLINEWLVQFLYSAQFLPAADLLEILLPGMVFLSVTRILQNDIGGRGYPELTFIADVPTVLLNIILSLVMVPRIGVKGAAWAITVSYGLQLALISLIYRAVSGNSFGRIFLIQQADLKLYKGVLNVIFRSAKLRFLACKKWA